jgi:hypothetical protein
MVAVPTLLIRRWNMLILDLWDCTLCCGITWRRRCEVMQCHDLEKLRGHIKLWKLSNETFGSLNSTTQRSIPDGMIPQHQRHYSKRNCKFWRKVWGLHSGVDEDSKRLLCQTVSMQNSYRHFGAACCLHFQGLDVQRHYSLNDRP